MLKLESVKTQIVQFFQIYLNINNVDSLGKRDGVQDRKDLANPPLVITMADEEGVSNNYHRINYKDWDLLVKDKFTKEFIAVMERGGEQHFRVLVKKIISNELNVKLIPAVKIKGVDAPFSAKEEAYWDGFYAENIVILDKRFDGAHAAIEKEFGHISKILQHAASLYAKDNTKAKVDDVYLFFVTKGKDVDFELDLAATTVPAYVESRNIEPNRVPMTPVEFNNYFGYTVQNKEKGSHGITDADEIMASLERVTNIVQTLLNHELVFKSKINEEYIYKKVNEILIPVIVTIRLEPFSTFGGELNQIDMIEGKSHNALRVAEVVDQAVTSVTNLLQSIPLSEGVAKYSLETDSLAVYGRDDKNQIVKTVIDPDYMFVTLAEKWSDGFYKAVVAYLKTIKNDLFFTTVGELAPKEEVSEPAKEETSEETQPE